MGPASKLHNYVGALKSCVSYFEKSNKRPGHRSPPAAACYPWLSKTVLELCASDAAVWDIEFLEMIACAGEAACRMLCRSSRRPVHCSRPAAACYSWPLKTTLKVQPMPVQVKLLAARSATAAGDLAIAAHLVLELAASDAAVWDPTAAARCTKASELDEGIRGGGFGAQVGLMVRTGLAQGAALVRLKC
eukprot:1158235-Pelagomonas_calceolata.AAC.2